MAKPTRNVNVFRLEFFHAKPRNGKRNKNYIEMKYKDRDSI